VGLLKLRCYRPFPKAEVAKVLGGVSQVAVLEKNLSPGSGIKGAVALEVKDALWKTGIDVYSYVIGLGGRDVRKKDVAAVADLAERGIGDTFYGLREELI
jgi:pyruvate ferredoxin oxidoreductase alpha subunit